MRKLLALLVLLPLHASADDGAALASRVAAACGVDAWSGVQSVAFTWTHHPSGNSRSFVWRPKDHQVSMTFHDETTALDLDAIDTEDQRRAHAAFVNDSYWMLFELHLAWDDGVRFTELGAQPVPGFADLGERPALHVQYTGDGGYTPGDAYVLYLGDDDRPVAWAFHRGGAEEASLVTTREEWNESGSIHFPTRFLTADGAPFISIADVAIVREAD